MTIVAEIADISVSFDFFEEDICRLEQEAETKQNQADILIQQANMALEQVGLKRQQQARALKALVEAKQALKEALRLGLELGEAAGPIIQREIAKELDITIAPPVVAQVDEVPITAFLYPEEVVVPKTLTSLTPTGLEPEVLEAFDKQVGYSPKPPEWYASLESKECETEDPFDLPSEPETVVVRKVNSKVDIRKGIMGPIFISEDYPFLRRYQQHLHDKLGPSLGGYDTLLEDIGTDSCPKWQLLTSHLTDEQATILNKTAPQEVSALVPRLLTQKEKELNAYKKNVEAQKERILPFAESIGITIDIPGEEVKDTLPQLVEISNRMIYISGTQDGEHKQACYIGGANEGNLKAWGKWLTLSPDIATSSEVRSSKRIMKFKHELVVYGMSLEQLKVLKAEGMLALPPRQKSQASKDLGAKLVEAK